MAKDYYDKLCDNLNDESDLTSQQKKERQYYLDNKIEINRKRYAKKKLVQFKKTGKTMLVRTMKHAKIFPANCFRKRNYNNDDSQGKTKGMHD